MSKMEVQDAETGNIVGTIDIPDDVLAAAEKVSDWLDNQPSNFRIHGLMLADD